MIPAAAPRLSDADAARLRALLGEVFGWELGPESRVAMEGRLRRRLAELSLDDFGEYVRRLDRGPDRARELEHAADLLSTRETYFFREGYQLEALSREIVPRIVEARESADPAAPRRLRIWSAGCASGEEPYTLAMIAADHPLLAGWEVEVHASDIAPSALAAARRGEYDAGAVRLLPRDMLERHFTQIDDATEEHGEAERRAGSPQGGRRGDEGRTPSRWRVRDEIRALVRIEAGNLAAGDGPPGPFDVVVCRNVLIYFSSVAKKFLAERFFDRLAPGGWLLLGHAESLATVSRAFELARLERDIVYRRPALGVFRVLVADDSAFARRTLSRIVTSVPGVELCAAVGDGLAALREVKRHEPHLLLLDLHMPELDGFGVLRGLSGVASPPAVIVVSGQADAATAVKALELGAFDFVAKPAAEASPDLERVADALVPRIEVLRTGRPRLRAFDAEHAPTGRYRLDDVEAPEAPAARKVVVVGASTGGPGTLLEVLKGLPERFPAAVVIAVHMPPGFTSAFAERIARRGRLAAAEAEAGGLLREGRVVICPGGHHVSLAATARGVITLVTAGAGEPWTPSVDKLLASAAPLGAAALGVVLTGMGTDGAKGALALREAGGRVLVESPETAVVGGMPGAAVACGAAHEVRRQEDLAAAIRAWALE